MPKKSFWPLKKPHSIFSTALAAASKWLNISIVCTVHAHRRESMQCVHFHLKSAIYKSRCAHSFCAYTTQHWPQLLTLLLLLLMAVCEWGCMRFEAALNTCYGECVAPGTERGLLRGRTFSCRLALSFIKLSRSPRPLPSWQAARNHSPV